ncbi:MAG TPA: hypothetical protein VHW02_10075 [Rhizomicrobium sp.]|jgi:hypothetical protein|nr:hypothetical protein [Rhizomicrobium sp.]
MEQFANAVVDCDAALKLNPKMASSLYVKGVAELRLNTKDVGNADVAAAEAIDPKIAGTYAGYGVKP